MHSIRFLAIDSAFEVHALAAHLPGDEARAAAVDGLWREEQEQRAEQLPDGKVLAFVEADRSRLIGRLVRQRDVVAGRRAPELFDGHPPEPVQVGALISSRGRLLLGHRRDTTQGAPGSWELVSSDVLDDAFRNPAGRSLDFQAALLARLVECAPLPRPARRALQPLTLAHNADAGFWRVCVGLELPAGAPTTAEIEACESSAYDAFRFVRPVDVIESGPDGADELAPLAAALVRMPRGVTRVA